MNNNIIPRAFTVEYSGIVNTLETKVRISEAFNPESHIDVIHPPTHEFNSVWDTGATNSAISSNVVRELGLTPYGYEIVYHAGGMSIVDTYLINVIIPNNIIFISLLVTEMLIDVDVLIGMDIISTGDFTITVPQGKTKFSFQIPSTHDTDYMKSENS